MNNLDAYSILFFSQAAAKRQAEIEEKQERERAESIKQQEEAFKEVSTVLLLFSQTSHHA